MPPSDIDSQLMRSEDGTLRLRQSAEAKFVLISQDEKIYHSNDQLSRYWSDGSFTKLPAKSAGRTVMSSDFLSEVYGLIRHPETAERVGSLLDVGTDGYYTNERCLADFAECSKVVRLLSQGKYKCIFLTDHSPIHSKFAQNALNVKAMNVKPGGKQPKMRDGWFISDGRRVVQEMNFAEDHPLYPGKPKGLREVVRERFGASAIVGKRHDDLVAMLQSCDDFVSQKSLLEEEAVARGDIIIFGVKFHPELMPIEAAYRTISKAVRVSNTTGSSSGFKRRVDECQRTPELTLELIRKYFRSAREYLRNYSEGKSMAEIETLRSERRKHREPAVLLNEGAADEEDSQLFKKGRYDRNRLE
ncbi:hypothetical protein FOZ61_003201 [Perkinsus olseni]|uniref:Uncharacterized protein n=1 Tax=Perkinsus olseni TaxID=32597 RepID=A0A7J6KL87_PEROL|nr:hypothetical protein FOZ61_003201 [Perkinsus olseni]KAF4648431.1 hypothetical protein FOL46_002884 [Perkinsus olseni]